MAISRSFTILATLAAILVAVPVCPAQDPFTGILRGLVVDAKDDPVRGARILIRGADKQCLTDGSGVFACPAPASGDFSFEVAAEGFRSAERITSVDSEIRVRLEPLAIREVVVVVSDAQPVNVGETAASVTVLDRNKLEATAAPGIDDALRQTAGFTLFRRTSSRTANPTTQGASLRGINPSGASRTLVLLDSAPLNDPFGGWVPWASIPPVAVDSVEVLRGGASSLYGSDSIGGTILVRRRRVSRRNVVSAEGFAGSQQSGSGSVFTGISRDRFEADMLASAFSTNGYVPVESDARGLADGAAGSRNALISTRLAPSIGILRGFVRATYFRETRKNGTRLQRNALLSRRLEAGADPVMPELFPGTAGTSLSIRAFATFQVFDQSFSAVADDRNSETLVRIQRVPSQISGLSVRFATSAGINAISAGLELDETRGASDELGFFNGNPTARSGAGGRERNTAFYAQDRIAVGARVILTGRIRVDSWRNFSALNALQSASTGSTSVTLFPDREEASVSPGASILVFLSDQLSAYFSASRSFRAPTLNELYRGFRVGNVVTLPNEDLRAETSVNFEGGAAYWQDRWGIRGTVFSSTIEDSITNVTIDADSSPILRQRQNAAKVKVTGLEIEGELRAGRIAVSGSYIFVRSRYEEFPGAPMVEGKRLPQSPTHSIAGQFRYDGSGGRTAGLQARVSSAQFDDDLNTFRLGAYLQVDIFGSLRLSEKARLFAAFENVLNTRCTVGLNPVRAISAPIGFRGGIRWN